MGELSGDGFQQSGGLLDGLSVGLFDESRVVEDLDLQLVLTRQLDSVDPRDLNLELVRGHCDDCPALDLARGLSVLLDTDEQVAVGNLEVVLRHHDRLAKRDCHETLAANARDHRIQRGRHVLRLVDCDL